MGRPKKHVPETALEKLQAENACLRGENALLKKVKALVKEREARERMSGQQPSKD
jgi:transposase